MTDFGHILAIGESQSGKTTKLNELHVGFPQLSVLVDTKGGPQGRSLAGMRISTFDRFELHVAAGHDKFVYDPPRHPDASPIWPRAHEHLADFWGKMRRSTSRSGWRPTPEEPGWWQVVLTEGHRWRMPYRDDDGKMQPAPPTVDEMIQQALGFGGRVAFESQYATSLDAEMRTNFPTRLVFRPGLENVNVLRQWQWPVDDVVNHTNEHKYGFARYTRERQWEFFRPRSPT